MNFNWNEVKNQQLQNERGVSFENIQEAIVSGGLLEDIPHPNQEQYSHQRLLIVELNNYAYVVPYVVEQDGTLFLKTVYKSREATKKYLVNQ